MKQIKMKLISSLIIASTVSSMAWAHGALSYPESRQWMCSAGPSPNKSTPWNGGSNPICRALANDSRQVIFTDWSGVAQGSAGGWSDSASYKQDPLSAHKRVIGNGGICGGGSSTYSGLNDPKYHWETKATHIEPGMHKFTYAVSAPHRTYSRGYVDVYITKDSWKVGTPVTFNDLDPQPICHYSSVPGNSPIQTGRDADGTSNNFESFNCEIPANKQGDHVLFTVWQRHDSAESFYSCSDIKVDNNTPIEISWNPLYNESGISQLPHLSNLKTNDKIELSITNKSTQETVTTSLIISSNNMNDWQYALANQLNNQHPFNNKVLVGVRTRDGKDVQPAKSNYNQVYIDKDIALPQNYTWSVIHTAAKPEPISEQWAPLSASGRSSNELYDIPNLKAGDKLVFRLFNNKLDMMNNTLSGNNDIDSIELEVTSNNLSHWKYALANTFNNKASTQNIIKIGALGNDGKTVTPSITDENRVYILKEEIEKPSSGYSWIIDVKAKPGPEPEPTEDDYKPGYPYKAGDVVTLGGQYYQCKPWPYSPWCAQAAYRPDGIYGDQAWKKIAHPPKPEENTYDPTKHYNAGDTVLVDGVQYRCKPWPYTPWCSQEAYRPDGIYGSQAWDRV